MTRSANRAPLLGALLLTLAGCGAGNPLGGAPAGPAAPPLVVAQSVPPTSAPAAVATAAPTATPTAAPTAAPTSIPTATPRRGPPRIGIQVGHWKTDELPEELARFRTSTGAYVNGLSELEVNLDVAQRVAELLRAEGLEVDLLPATIPVAYEADALISIHADGSTAGGASGYKMATPWRTSAASQLLYESLMAEYGVATGLPEDFAITANMRGYYAFNWRRHRHAIAKTTPAVIVEMGFLTNPGDRAFLRQQPDRAARGIANGALRYLAARDPADAAGLVPQEFSAHRFVADGAAVHAAPDAGSRVIFTAEADLQFTPFRESDGWYEGFVRGQQSRAIGWVRKELLAPTNDPFPTPTGQ